MKAQIISMDFVITFVVYIFALSIFFLGVSHALEPEKPDLDIHAELLFSRLDQIYMDDIDFLDGSRIDAEKLNQFIMTKSPVTPQGQNEMYSMIFKDFEVNPFKTDFCAYIQNGSTIQTYFGAGIKDSYSIMFRQGSITHSCFFEYSGSLPSEHYNFKPYCDSDEAETIIVKKPVYYNGGLVSLNIIACMHK